MISVILCSHRLLTAVMAGQNLNTALPVAIEARYGDEPLSPPDRAQVRHITYSALRHWGTLTGQIDVLCPQRPKPALRILLAVGLALLQLTRTKPFVAVDQTVRAANVLGFNGQRGFINAVLRNYQRRAEELCANHLTTAEAQLNFPGWWIEQAKRSFGDHYIEILRAQNEHPPMTIRVNESRTNVHATMNAFAAANIQATAITGAAILLTEAVDVKTIPGFAEGLVSVQDYGAQYACDALDLAPLLAKPNARVLDACAAPGGKTCHILERLSSHPSLHLTALDVDAARIKSVRSNLDRLALECDLKVADAAVVASWWDGQRFDRILLDAPCSASGTARRNPDVRWGRRESDIAQFAQVQARLLDALWPTLATGGKLVYATCSVFEAENSLQIASFLERNLDAQLESLAQRAGMQSGLIAPSLVSDGFFYARLVKFK